MFRIIKYSLLQQLRNKALIFWTLMFPIVLSVMFSAAFSGIISKSEFHPIPIAVVLEDTEESDILKSTLDSIGEDTFHITYCEDEKATKLLKDKKIIGAICASTQIKAKFIDNMKNENINQSILQSFVDSYNLHASALSHISRTHPENLNLVMEQMSKDINYNKEISLSKHNTNSFATYYASLIAMSCLFSGMFGISICLKNQANLSPLGARVSVASIHKFQSIFGQFIAGVIFQFCCNSIGYFFILFVLKINLGNNIFLALLTIFTSDILAISFGYFIGSIGKFSANAKEGIMVAVTLTSSFLSGLMVGSMRIVIDDFCPIINKINPASLISDCFYSLSIYESYDRYFQNLITIVIFSIIFLISGLLLTRRSKYASI